MALASIATSVASFRPFLRMAEPILKSEPEVNEEKEVFTELVELQRLEQNEVK